MKRVAKHALAILWPTRRRAPRRRRHDPDRVIRAFLHVLERLRPVLQGGGPAPSGVMREKP
ncbi:MAG: hypothetical protein NVSMB26_13780 [Beijerinckiaceae bacterium]